MLNRYEQIIQQGKLPNLKIIKIDNILLHEDINKQSVEKLRTRIGLSGILQNPIVCTRIRNYKKFLLLDGAHRYTALKELECRYVPAQIVDYHDPLLKLKKWGHLFNINDEQLIIDTAKNIKNVQCEISKYKKSVTFHKITPRFYAQIILKSGRSILITGKNYLKEKIDAINTLSSLYIESGLIDRISYDDFDSLITYYQDFTGLIIYPQFTKDEITQIARKTPKLPAGITRHIIPKRVLHLNMPLNILRFADNQSEVEKFLMDFINQRIKNKAIRFYSESTFFFDD